jgi:hypothetical protein
MTGSLPADVIERFLARSRAERIAAGFPEHLEDGPTLDRIVSIVANIVTTPETRNQRRQDDDATGLGDDRSVDTVDGGADAPPI